MRFRLRRVLLLVPIIGVVLTGPARGDELHSTLAEYSLSSWTEKDGLASNVIRSIAQDSRGYLWVATDGGLVRFDGARFVPWDEAGMPRLPGRSVRTVFLSRDGSVWIGLDDSAGVSRVSNGEARHYGEQDGIGPGSVTLLLEDVDGTIWAGNGSGLYGFTGGGSHTWASPPGLPPGAVLSGFTDSLGNLYVETHSGIFKRARGRHAFEPIETFVAAGRREREHPRFEAGGAATARRSPVTGGITRDSKGRIWLTDLVSGFRLLGRQPDLAGSATQGRGIRLLYDTKGNLWIATQGQGLWRVHDTSDADAITVERLTTLNGLLSDGVTALLEDRQGDIWVGTRDGLNRLTPHKVTGITNLGVVDMLEATPDGSVWVGTVDELIRFPAPNTSSRRERTLLGGSRFRAMDADRDGTLWVATDRDLFRFGRGRPSRVPLPTTGRTGHFNSITSDSSGGLWLDDNERGLFHWDGRTLDPFALPAEFKHTAILCLYGDRRGRVWIGFSDGRVGRLEGAGFRSYGPPDGLNAGVYQTIYEATDGTIWLGGSEGLSRFRDGRFTSVRGHQLDTIRTLIEDDTSILWLGTDSGILRVNPDEFEKVATSPAHQIHYTLYDKSDGLAGRPRMYGNSVRAKDGRLWFVTSRGVTIISPAALKESAGPVPVHVEGVIGNDERFYPQSGAALAPGTTRLEIDYAVLNLTASSKTRFRYRLEGFDRDWVDAGPRRQAFYTNLPPGRYRFHVLTDNNDGAWDEPGAVWDFSIQPAFYQTGWFYVACATTPIFFVWTTWRLHIRRVRKEFTLLLGERARLSREIHDTLLQSLVGVALQCDALADDLDSPSPPDKQRFVRLRKEVEGYIREARQSILDLRSPKLERPDLRVTLREVGERAAAGRPIAFDFGVSGTPHRCAPVVEEQLVRIGQEAVLNAIRHARATHLRMELTYDHPSVALRVCDDGCGFDCENPGLAQSGHYGLTTMRERAETLGGDFDIGSRMGRGTTITTVLPSWPHQ